MSKKTSIYLAGVMEHSADLGASWRSRLQERFEAWGYNVLNPVEFEPLQLAGLQPKRLPEYCTNQLGAKIQVHHWHDLKHAVEPHLEKRFQCYMKRVKDYDKGLIRNEVDYIVAVINGGSGGTTVELDIAGELGIPVYCLELTPAYAWSVPDCTKRFKDWKSFDAFLEAEFKKENK